MIKKFRVYFLVIIVSKLEINSLKTKKIDKKLIKINIVRKRLKN